MLFANLDQLNNKQKLLGMHIFLKIASIAKKSPVKVTSTTFLFQRSRTISRYQLLPNLATGEDFEWLSSGSEPVSMWGSL